MLQNIIYGFSVVAFVFAVASFPGNVSAADTDSEDVFFDESLAVKDENLGEMRGTALSPEILGIAVLDAVSSNNTSNGTVSGGNIIGSDAFSQSSGLSTVIQNSGNNVLIQAATILNVNIQ